ncbi:MAG: hypothetical protein GEU86_22175 [Actinophytocola sp.]|nr:hypothetical protein [Actinophytocola sp.]
MYDLRAVPIPEPVIRSVRRRSTRLGLTVFGLGLIIGPALVIWPFSLVPSGYPLRPGMVMFGGMAAFCLLGSGAMTLGARACVSSGYLKLTDMRVTRAALMFFLVLATMSAPLAWGVFALIAGTRPSESRPDVSFDASAWLYIFLLMSAVALTWLCFFGLRSVLWRSEYAPKR